MQLPSHQTDSTSTRRPFILWVLVASLLFLATGGLYGGIAMLVDPTGAQLQLTEVLPHLPVADFKLPGLFLLFLMGFLPTLLIYGLVKQPLWHWAEHLARWSGHHWAWTGTMALAGILACWLTLQGLLIGFRWPIQFVTAANGLLIAFLAGMPSVRGMYVRKAPTPTPTPR